MNNLDENKSVVLRFNTEVIEQGNIDSFNEIIDKDFINRTALAAASGPEGLFNTLYHVLRPAFPDLKIEIYDQIAEGDKVTTRKAIHATHKGELMGIPATHRKVKIEMIDIVRLRNGKYIEHWGMNNLPVIIAQLNS